jgi:hypothetical protein
MPGIQEFLIIVLVIIILSLTGLWPVVVRGLRELRGEPVQDNSRESASSPAARRNSMDMEICCRLLGISPSASWEEIEKAYRTKAKIHHPDRGGDKDAMSTLNEAYTYLKKIHRTRGQ